VRSCPRCGSKVEAYRTNCDCGFSWEPQALSETAPVGQYPGEFRPIAYNEPRRRTYVWPWLLSVLVMGIGAWHLICSQKIEASIYEYIEPHLSEGEINATLEINIQPISNLVSIDLKVLADGADELTSSDRLIIDAVLVYIRAEVEPYIERELSLAARRQVDLYAMAFPYRSAFSLDIGTQP
jgi:hypothetical protein